MAHRASGRQSAVGMPAGMPGGLRSHPLTDLDLAHRAWVPNSGWPFDRQALDPFYATGKRSTGVGGRARPRHIPPLEGAGIETALALFVDRPAIESIEAQALASPHIEVYLNATTLRLDEAGAGIQHATVHTGGTNSG